MPLKPTQLVSRKLLVAAIGVATVNYVGCETSSSSGNLPAPQPSDTSKNVGKTPPPTSGNLPAPFYDAGEDADADAGDSGVK